MVRTTAFRLLASLAATVTAVAACEALVRGVKPQMTYSRLQALVGDQYAPDDVIPFSLKPNYRAGMPSMESPGETVTVSVNSLGFRGPEVTLAKPAGTQRILVLGDSYTFGVYCDDREPFPAVLERLYAGSGEAVQVINAGYTSGSSPDEHYAWLMKKGWALDPDVVVYAFFVGNDIEGINPSGWAELDAAALPRKVIDPDLWVDEFGRLRSRVRDSRTVGHEWVFRVPLLRESHSLILANRAVLRMLDDTYSNNGWGESPFPFVLAAETPASLRDREERFFRLIGGLHREAAARDARFVLLMIPVNFQVDPRLLPQVLGSRKFSIARNYFDEIKPRLQSLGIEFADLLQPMQEHSNERFFPQNGEVHFNPAGHAFAAQVLRQHLAPPRATGVSR